MISVCFLFFKIPLPRGGSFPSIVIPTGAKHRVQSPLERWPRTISTDRPEMESRPYEFLLHPQSTQLAQPGTVHCDYPWSRALGPGRILGMASLQSRLAAWNWAHLQPRRWWSPKVPNGTCAPGTLREPCTQWGALAPWRA